MQRCLSIFFACVLIASGCGGKSNPSPSVETRAELVYNPWPLCVEPLRPEFSILIRNIQDRDLQHYSYTVVRKFDPTGESATYYFGQTSHFRVFTPNEPANVYVGMSDPVAPTGAFDIPLLMTVKDSRGNVISVLDFIIDSSRCGH